MRVIDLMTSDVVTVGPETSLKEAARKMVSSRVSGLPVVDEDGKLAGIITEADFLRREMEREHPQRYRLLGAIIGSDEHVLESAESVREAMNTSVVTISMDASLAEAARIMTKRRVKRLPVIDTQGRLLGIISRADIVAAFTRPDEVIEDEIREDVIRRVLFLDPDGVGVEVGDGVVTLTGDIPTRTEARLLEELTRRLDGVVSVDNQLHWMVDDTKLGPEVAPRFPQA